MAKKETHEQALWIVCRICGCNYLESIEWFQESCKTECPNCDWGMGIY